MRKINASGVDRALFSSQGFITDDSLKIEENQPEHTKKHNHPHVPAERGWEGDLGGDEDGLGALVGAPVEDGEGDVPPQGGGQPAPQGRHPVLAADGGAGPWDVGSEDSDCDGRRIFGFGLRLGTFIIGIFYEIPKSTEFSGNCLVKAGCWYFCSFSLER